MGQDLQDFYSLENNFIRYTWVVFYRFKSILLIENPPLMPNFSSKKHWECWELNLGLLRPQTRVLTIVPHAFAL